MNRPMTNLLPGDSPFAAGGARRAAVACAWQVPLSEEKSMAEERLRFGLIGCGGNMRAHVRRLVEIPEVAIQGIVEPNRENVEKAFETYPALAGTPVFADH